MLNEIFHDSLKMSKIYWDLFGKLFAHFQGIRLKIYRLPYFNMLFQLMLTKFFKTGLKIMDSRAPVMMTGQIFFTPDN